MSTRYLLACYKVPGWGGAATLSYLLFERMQKLGYDVAYVNLVDEKDAVLLRYLLGEHFGNPRHLANVHTSVLTSPLHQAHARLSTLIGALAPDILVGVGSVAARLLKLAAADATVVFITAGCNQFRKLFEERAVRDFVDFRHAASSGMQFPVQDWQEGLALVHSDVVIVNSPMVRFAFDHFFPRVSGKLYSHTISLADLVYEEAAAYRHYAQDFAQRDIDVLFAATSWRRPEKNYRMVRRLMSHLTGLNVHVVGDTDRTESAIRYHGIVSKRETVFRLLGRAKVFVSPSLLDAAPLALFEASAMGCNVVASPNCGNYALCSETLAVESCTTRAFANKITLALASPYEDNQRHFHGDCDDLFEVLTLF